MRLAPSLVVASVVLLTASACATPRPNCAEGCEVSVTIPACGSGIKVAPDPIVVPPGRTVDITWSIKSPGWAFDGDKGIVIHRAGEAFAKAPGKPDSQAFRVRNNNNRKDPRTYKYDVNLVDARTQEKCLYDPTIINQ